MLAYIYIYIYTCTCTITMNNFCFITYWLHTLIEMKNQCIYLYFFYHYILTYRNYSFIIYK